MKRSGTCWVNLGDSYGGSGNSSGHTEDTKNLTRKTSEYGASKGNQKNTKQFAKSLLMIPQRFAIEMVNRGWILRNVIIWHKPNCMPSSAKDRFTVDFEYVYFFVKNRKSIYWVNQKTRSLVNKKPLGTKGIEDIDWDWYECTKCLGTGIKHDKCKYCDGDGQYYDSYLKIKNCEKCQGIGRIRRNIECKSCKGLGRKKKSNWKGKDYWFEQQFEKSTTEFIYSRNSQKGCIQDKNNPRNNWGKTKEELKIEKNKGYNSKYKNHEYGQTIQGHIRSNSQKQERDQSRNDAKLLFPTNIKKQQDYINYIHDHGLSHRLGRNKRTVWRIHTKGKSDSHFAIFPPDLVRPMILSGCPKFICTKCGNPREQIIKSSIINNSMKNFDNIKYSKANLKLSKTSTILTKEVIPKEIKGYSDCGCNAGFKSGIVLDPFAGTGTTLLEAWKLGRNYIGFEISKDYCEINKKNLSSTKYIRLDNFIKKKIEV